MTGSPRYRLDRLAKMLVGLVDSHERCPACKSPIPGGSRIGMAWDVCDSCGQLPGRERFPLDGETEITLIELEDSPSENRPTLAERIKGDADRLAERHELELPEDVSDAADDADPGRDLGLSA